MDMGDIEYLYVAKFSDYLRGIQIQIDNYSINRFLICKKDEIKYLISQDYGDRGTCKITKYTMLLPYSIPYIH